MQVTLNLDEDVAALVQKRLREAEVSMEAVVNAALRRSLGTSSQALLRSDFEISSINELLLGRD